MTWGNQLSTLFRSPSFDAQIDRLFAEAIHSLDDRRATWTPDCNVFEDGNHFCVQVALPGMDVGQMDLQVENRVVTVKGERKDMPGEKRIWYHHEIKDGPFACSFQLPSYVDEDAATASYGRGVLTIMFPKREEAKPRCIMIESRSS